MARFDSAFSCFVRLAVGWQRAFKRHAYLTAVAGLLLSGVAQADEKNTKVPFWGLHWRELPFLPAKLPTPQYLLRCKRCRFDRISRDSSADFLTQGYKDWQQATTYP